MRHGTAEMYNGHPSYNYWNVALWIANDEGLYRLALDCIRQTGTRAEAARAMLEALSGGREHIIPTTPDGAPYTVKSIQHAMRGLS